MAYDFILVIVVTSLFVIHTFSHTLTLLSGLYQMLLDSAAVYIMLCCCVQRLVVILNCYTYKDFAKSYRFRHETSSPLYPQSNGLAELVQTAKRLLSRSDDPQLALLTYRATPLPWCNLSPAQLLMGRSLRTTVHQVTSHLIPKWNYLEEFREKDKDFKEKQKRDYDCHYRTSEMPDIPEDTAVWIRSGNKPQKGRVVACANKPRSYLVDTSTGRLRRNRSHLQVVPYPKPEETKSEISDPMLMQNRIVT